MIFVWKIARKISPKCSNNKICVVSMFKFPRIQAWQNNLQTYLNCWCIIAFLDYSDVRKSSSLLKYPIANYYKCFNSSKNNRKTKISINKCQYFVFVLFLKAMRQTNHNHWWCNIPSDLKSIFFFFIHCMDPCFYYVQIIMYITINPYILIHLCAKTESKNCMKCNNGFNLRLNCGQFGYNTQQNFTLHPMRIQHGFKFHINFCCV